MEAPLRLRIPLILHEGDRVSDRLNVLAVLKNRRGETVCKNGQSAAAITQIRARRLFSEKFEWGNHHPNQQ